MAEEPTQAQQTENHAQQSNGLEGGTYEIIRNRLHQQAQELRDRLAKLNTDRKQVFGAIETKLLSTATIQTAHNCIPADMVSIGNYFLFGYNVYIGLKTEIKLSDVFSVYSYANHQFQEQPLNILDNAKFHEDYTNLYRYYKKARFVKFGIIGQSLFMVFQIGNHPDDIKTFKWAINDDQIIYRDNRSDHEFRFPDQHEFQWKRTRREDQRLGEHPHISIEDKVFVETVGGDLTIKVENNTESGLGIYAEDVEVENQTLDDSDISYALVGNLIVLRIRPYQEKQYRYIVYNQKLQEARRIDALEDSCVLLPDDQGLIFAKGYYLQTGEYKLFDYEVHDMLFEKRINAPNGEDYLYIFYNKTLGAYILLSYNLIEQQVATPILCHGWTFFDNGEMCYFKAGNDPKRHHDLQIWQTPYVSLDYELPVDNDNFLYKIGNKDIVRGMAECHEALTLLNKEDSYLNLYLDLRKKTTTILDSYYWLDKAETYQLNEPLQAIRESAKTAITEFEKVTRIKKDTHEATQKATSRADTLFERIRMAGFDDINVFVQLLADLRTARGEIISLKELRYVNETTVEDYDQRLAKATDKLSHDCIEFLLRDDALDPYKNKVQEIESGIEGVDKVMAAKELEEELDQTARELDMLIEIVSNLNIEDATLVTRIIDNISTIYSSFNQIRAALRRRRKELFGAEAKAEFNAQIKLISQSLINYLDLCDTPAKCDEYLSKLMVQLEELEGKFTEFDDFIEQIGIKREEVYNAFESKKIALIESRNKRANNLAQSAERIIKAIQNRLSQFKTVADINGYFAADLMIEKVRDIIEQLLTMDDTVKADSIQSRLKTTREDAVRQLKDKTDLYEGENTIRFGNYIFTVNTQTPGLTMVYRDEAMYYHLTGTGFFEEVTNEAFNQTRAVWNQSFLSENHDVYRSEYLAYQIFTQPDDWQALQQMSDDDLKQHITGLMNQRYNEGYMKGVHDHDTFIILRALLHLRQNADLLRYPPTARACAELYWSNFISQPLKEHIRHQLRGVGAILQTFPDTREFEGVIEDLQTELQAFISQHRLFDESIVNYATEYLFHEISRDDNFVIDKTAIICAESFLAYLKKQGGETHFKQSTETLMQNPVSRYRLIRNWLNAFLKQHNEPVWYDYVDEVAVSLFNESLRDKIVIDVPLHQKLSGLQGSHSVIEDQSYQLNYIHFIEKMANYQQSVVPQFEQFNQLKHQLVENFEADMRLSEFKPRVLSSFVRNQLIDKVYLPLVGSNLAKQIGTAGESKRTDQMGLLLLISPPGYGKTTLMEYLANRLGIIFMKINGPAIGHQVTAVDPMEAPNAAAREELEKLNLAFEMGDNVMIYLDDIQHCNPEFLQKFISLSDAQRKIEGTYKGRTKTYDFRGKKVCIVMAGNPYTESGERFQIPDMLANRADIYNLGDIIGDSEGVFTLSYIENSLTSNPVLSRLAGKSHKDLYPLMKIAENNQREGLEFEASHSPDEIQEYVNVLKKLIRVRDTIYRVNQQYIASAAQSDEYRTEPAFKLQGSYRDMNKIAEKILPVMNDQELQTLINSHYENEAQTLTADAEANLLKFKELNKLLTKEDQARWQEIKAVFQKQQRLNGFGQNNQIGQLLVQVEAMTQGLDGIRQALLKG